MTDEDRGNAVRVAGYVREAQNIEDGESAFAQSERIRRWAADGGHLLVATCQDPRDPLRPSGGDGFRALLAIASLGAADAVVVADLTVLSADAVVQEIAIDRLRSLGVTIVSTNPDDETGLVEPSDDPTRRIVRDVLEKINHFRHEFPPSP